jgi:type I restriction enzyme S subunit
LKLPFGWKIMRVEDVAESINAGGTPRRNVKEYWENGDIPWLKISDLKSIYISESEEKITQKGLENSSAKLFSKGTVLFSIFATLGAVGILAKPSATNQAIAGIMPRKEIVDEKFLYYALKAEKDNIVAKKTHATQDNINLTVLRRHEIAVPPRETQTKIVAILDKTEQLRQLRNQSDTLAKDYISSVFRRMFGDPFSNERFQLEKISDVTSMVSYGFTRHMPHVEKGIPIITSKNVIAGNIDFDNVDYTDDRSFSELSKKDCPQKGDILYTKDGRIGEAAAVATEGRFCISQAVAVLRPLTDKMNPVFLEQLLNTNEFRKVVHRMAYGVALKHVSISKLKQLRIIRPGIELQNGFAQINSEYDGVRDLQLQSKKSILGLLTVMEWKLFEGV